MILSIINKKYLIKFINKKKIIIIKKIVFGNLINYYFICFI